MRAYGFDLLAFCRWLAAEGLGLGEVSTDVLLRFLRACRDAQVPGRPGPNVVTLYGRRSTVRPDHGQPSAGRGLGSLRVRGDA